MIQTTEFDGRVEIQFDSGMKVTLVEEPNLGLTISATGFSKDTGKETFFVRPQASNKITLFFGGYNDHLLPDPIP